MFFILVMLSVTILVSETSEVSE